MNNQEKFDKLIARRPHDHTPFFRRPHWSRRMFMEVAGTGLTASMLAPGLTAAETVKAAAVTPKGTAKNVIFILLAGAPSHMDTFDFKNVAGVTPTAFAPETINGVVWPTGLMPKLGGQLSKFAIARSVRSWALVHSLATTWTQIGRNPAAASGDIAPNMGSIVAVETAAARQPGHIFPSFLALNSNNATGSGYLSSTYGPFKFNANPTVTGIPNTARNAQTDDRWSMLHLLDDPLRVEDSPLGRMAPDYEAFYRAAKGLIDNALPGGIVEQGFRLTPADAARYGGTNFGAACCIAQQVLKANQGTRYIQITEGGWDMHTGIYAANQLPLKCTLLDNGVSALLTDLEASGLLGETLIVMMGEFGRTVGALSAAQGRDHFLQQFAFFAGGGVQGGRVIGSTNAQGSATVESQWSRNRDIKVEDIEATIYSALGINWTAKRWDDPFGRGFELVPLSDNDVYGPIHELWG